jgi:ABC-2 type transport system permease protein
MSWLTLADPLTYAVDAMRHAVAADRPAHGASALFAPVSWGGVRPTPAVELAVVAAGTLLALAVAARRFARTG